MKTPTQEQLKDPEWWDENAGTASHYCPINKQFYDCRLHSCCVARPKPQPAAAKPESQEWVDGLPPVGVECDVEYHTYQREWYKARILARDEGRVIGRWLEGPKVGGLFEYTRKAAFRLIKTDAERERDEVVEAAYQVWNDNAHLPAQGVLETLYDAGMLRKKEH